MKIGTFVKLTLIADERFLGHASDLETLISVHRTSLRTAIFGEGLQYFEIGNERVLADWEGTENEKQIRQDFTLILTKPLSKDSIYKIINQVQSQPLKFL